VKVSQGSASALGALGLDDGGNFGLFGCLERIADGD